MRINEKKDKKKWKQIQHGWRLNLSHQYSLDSYINFLEIIHSASFRSTVMLLNWNVDNLSMYSPKPILWHFEKKKKKKKNRKYTDRDVICDLHSIEINVTVIIGSHPTVKWTSIFNEIDTMNKNVPK